MHSDNDDRQLYERACAAADAALRRSRRLGYPPDPRAVRAIATRRAWLCGSASASDLDEAWWPAWQAAVEAAQRIGWDATRATQHETLRPAVWCASDRPAFEVAYAATYDNARSAAWAAVRKVAAGTVRRTRWPKRWSAVWDTAWHAEAAKHPLPERPKRKQPGDG